MPQMNRQDAKILYLVCTGIFIFYPDTAHAYLDPGTGSMLISALIGITAVVFFAITSAYYKIISLCCGLAGFKIPEGTQNDMVFYSDGPCYWNMFQPILAVLDESGTMPIRYLSSNQDDPGLAYPFKHVTTHYIGMGNRAFAVLNMLEAKVCVVTTPGLNVLQIRRSPGVRHYAYLEHSISSTPFYKLFALDAFDSIFCVGPQQVAAVRHIEKKRGLQAKTLYETGCVYTDILAEQLGIRLKEQQPSCRREDQACRVLVAPTWGMNGLLSRFGLELLVRLAQENFDLTIRPHPQSWISEKELLGKLQAALAAWSNIRWDTAVSGFEAMYGSDVLISDYSGIIFDYAFIFERPVITFEFVPEIRGHEASDLPFPPWELRVLKDLGAHVSPEAVASLPAIIASLPDKATFVRRVRAIRDAALFNYRKSGKTAAEQLVQLYAAMRGA